MYYREHQPPHFHAVYGDYEITVEIETGKANGRFPRRAQAHVLEWCEMHRQELMTNWNLARQRRELRKIAPLE